MFWPQNIYRKVHITETRFVRVMWIFSEGCHSVLVLNSSFSLSSVWFHTSLPLLDSLSLILSSLSLNQGSVSSLPKSDSVWLSPSVHSNVILHSLSNRGLFWTNLSLAAISPHPSNSHSLPYHSILFQWQHLHHCVPLSLKCKEGNDHSCVVQNCALGARFVCPEHSKPSNRDLSKWVHPLTPPENA